MKTIEQILEENPKLNCRGLRMEMQENPACFDSVKKSAEEWSRYRGVGPKMIKLLRENGHVCESRATYGLPDRYIAILDELGIGLDKKSVGDAIKSGRIPKPINNASNHLLRAVTLRRIGMMQYLGLRVYAFGDEARSLKYKC